MAITKSLNLTKHISYSPLLPQAHFGTIGRKPVKWQGHNEADPDDEELERTPRDVRMMLGFDPKKKVKK